MSAFDCMKEIVNLTQLRDDANRALQQACSRFVRAVVADLTLELGRPVASVLLEWEEDGTLCTFRAYDADSEEVRLFPSRSVEREFCIHNSQYLAPLYQRGHLASIEFKDGAINLIAYGLEG